MKKAILATAALTLVSAFTAATLAKALETPARAEPLHHEQTARRTSQPEQNDLDYGLPLGYAFGIVMISGIRLLSTSFGENSGDPIVHPRGPMTGSPISLKNPQKPNP